MFMKYLLSPANWLDWCHLMIMSIAWWFWYHQVNLTSQFKIDPSYDILASPADETQARFFMTNSTEEAKFLAFSKSLQGLGENLSVYTNMTSSCGIEIMFFRFKYAFYHYVMHFPVCSYPLRAQNAQSTRLSAPYGTSDKDYQQCFLRSLTFYSSFQHNLCWICFCWVSTLRSSV
jgi:hypothetical protein